MHTANGLLRACAGLQRRWRRVFHGQCSAVVGDVRPCCACGQVPRSKLSSRGLRAFDVKASAEPAMLQAIRERESRPSRQRGEVLLVNNGIQVHLRQLCLLCLYQSVRLWHCVQVLQRCSCARPGSAQVPSREVKRSVLCEQLRRRTRPVSHRRLFEPSLELPFSHGSV